MSMQKGDPVQVFYGGRLVDGVVYDVTTNKRGKIIGVRIQIPGMIIYRAIMNGRIQ